MFMGLRCRYRGVSDLKFLCGFRPANLCQTPRMYAGKLVFAQLTDLIHPEQFSYGWRTRAWPAMKRGEGEDLTSGTVVQPDGFSC